MQQPTDGDTIMRAVRAAMTAGSPIMITRTDYEPPQYTVTLRDGAAHFDVECGCCGQPFSAPVKSGFHACETDSCEGGIVVTHHFGG